MSRQKRRLPNNLRRLREERGLTMVRLAQQAGSVSTIFNIEQGNLVPGPQIRQALSEALGVTIRDIWPTLDTED